MSTKLKKISSNGNQSTKNIDEKMAKVQPDEDIITDIEPSPDEKTKAEEINLWDLSLISDSTSAADIISIIENDEGDILGMPDMGLEIDSFLDHETKYESPEKKLEAGLDLLHQFFIQQNRSWSGVIGIFGNYAIQTGRILIELKSLVKACGQKWEPWAAENLEFIKPRTRQTYMQLASVPGIDEYAHLGTERGLMLASATKGAQSDDPIGDFLKSHDLYFDPDAEIDLDRYKKAIDLALDYERIKKSGVEVQKESLKKYKMDGKKIDGSLIKTLKAVRNSGGDPNKHLTDPPTDDDANDSDKRVQSFKKLSLSLLGTIDWMIGHPESIEKVDSEKLEELTNKLEALKHLIDKENPDTEE
jgi:hypothetical protein